MKTIKTICIALFFASASLTSYGRDSNDKQEKIITENKKDTLSKIRFDGIYQSEYVNSFIYCFRFYSDGTVTSTTLFWSEPAIDVFERIKKPWKDQGTYEINGDNIYFTTTSPSGTVVYEGIIESEYKLNLKSKSLINGHIDEKSYYFVKP